MAEAIARVYASANVDVVCKNGGNATAATDVVAQVPASLLFYTFCKRV